MVDLVRSDEDAWAYFIYVDRTAGTPQFVRQSYADRSAQVDFWPASTIKMYTATAALELLSDWGASIDSEATFYRQTNGVWVEDITLSFREIIHRTFNCSSNQTYTLLLRFAGLDWINSEFFVRENGFQETALMRGYVTSTERPYGYVQRELQRIIVRDQWTRVDARTCLVSATLCGCRGLYGIQRKWSRELYIRSGYGQNIASNYVP